MLGIQRLTCNKPPVPSLATGSRTLLTGARRLPTGFVTPSPFATSRLTDMRRCAQNSQFDGAKDWENIFFRSSGPDPNDHERAELYDQLMNDHFDFFSNAPRMGKGGSEPPMPENLSCIISPNLELESVMRHFNSKVRLLHPNEMAFFKDRDISKELLLPGDYGRLVKLTQSDQQVLQEAIAAVVPSTSRAEGEGEDPRNHVLLIQGGTSLEGVYQSLMKSYPIVPHRDAWRDFTRCLPSTNGIVDKDMAVNTWPLFDLTMQRESKLAAQSGSVNQIMPLYQWMRAGQEQGVFSESVVTNCRTLILEQALASFLRSLVSRSPDNMISKEGSSLLEHFGVPVLERCVLEKIFDASAIDVEFEKDFYAGGKAFTTWFDAASPGILKYCDRDQPVSIVSPKDERWQAVGVSSDDLPLVRVNPEVKDVQIKDFLVGLGGSVIQAFGLHDAMAVFGSEASRKDTEDCVFSIAKTRDRFVNQFMTQLMLETEVMAAKELHQTMVQKGFPKQVQKLTKAGYENSVRETVGRLFEKNRKPVLLFSVPKLYDFVDKIIDYGLKANSLESYMRKDRNAPSPIVALLHKHVQEMDRK